MQNSEKPKKSYFTFFMHFLVGLLIAMGQKVKCKHGNTKNHVGDGGGVIMMCGEVGVHNEIDVCRQLENCGGARFCVFCWVELCCLSSSLKTITQFWSNFCDPL